MGSIKIFSKLRRSAFFSYRKTKYLIIFLKYIPCALGSYFGAGCCSITFSRESVQCRTADCQLLETTTFPASEHQNNVNSSRSESGKHHTAARVQLSHYLTDHFPNFVPQNPRIDIFELDKICQSPDFEALK